MDREDQEKRDAELGYRTAGARELGLRDWMALRGDPDEVAPTPRAFAVLVNRLRSVKWAKDNPAKANARFSQVAEAAPRPRPRRGEEAPVQEVDRNRGQGHRLRLLRRDVLRGAATTRARAEVLHAPVSLAVLRERALPTEEGGDGRQGDHMSEPKTAPRVDARDTCPERPEYDSHEPLANGTCRWCGVKLRTTAADGLLTLAQACAEPTGSVECRFPGKAWATFYPDRETFPRSLAAAEFRRKPEPAVTSGLIT